MDVEIIEFPETRVAAITHAGPPQAEHDTARKLVAWKLQQGLRDPARHRSYGLHHLDDQGRRGRVDFCLSVDGSGAPLIFHYVNVGPQVQPHEAITDVYLPLA